MSALGGPCFVESICVNESCRDTNGWSFPSVTCEVIDPGGASLQQRLGRNEGTKEDVGRSLLLLPKT